MRVVLNDRALTRTLTGVGNYIAQLLMHMPETSTDINAVIGEVRQLMQQTLASEGVHVRTDLDARLPTVPADHDRPDWSAFDD